MTLIGIKGSLCSINKELLLYAVEHAPSLLLDCANCADPQQLFPFVEPERFERVYVVEIEMLYLFRDVLKRARTLAREIGASCVVITPFSMLFSYDNEKENSDIFDQCWELVKELAKTHEVVVGIHESYERLAANYCDKLIEIKGELMGHTLVSQRMTLDMLINELSDFGRALRRDDRLVFDTMLKMPLKHVGSISYASSFHAWAFLLLSILLEQEKKLNGITRIVEPPTKENQITQDILSKEKSTEQI
jgi:hypothetical protein